MNDQFWLTEEQVERLWPNYKKVRGKPRSDDRTVLSSIIHVKRLAIRLIHEALMNTPGITWAYGPLASLYDRIGDVANAAAAAGKLLEAYPGLTIERLAASVPPAVAERNPAYLDGLRGAGIT